MGMTDDDMEMMKAASVARGEVINAMTILEKIIDTFLSHHFCSSMELRNEILDCLFASKKITFENKRALLKQVLDRHHKEYRNTHLPNIHAQLGKFNDYRNEVAHFAIDPSDSAVKNFKETGGITLLKFENSKETVIYTPKKVKEISEEIYKVIEPLAILIKK